MTGLDRHRATTRATPFLLLHTLLFAPVFLVIASCTTVPPGDTSGDTPSPDCASEFAPFVGQPRSVLLATSFTAPIRIIDPGEVVTQDYLPERINFVIGQDRRIERMYCG